VVTEGHRAAFPRAAAVEASPLDSQLCCIGISLMLKLSSFAVDLTTYVLVRSRGKRQIDGEIRAGRFPDVRR
jgi:hypothetical protein